MTTVLVTNNPLTITADSMTNYPKYPLLPFLGKRLAKSVKPKIVILGSGSKVGTGAGSVALLNVVYDTFDGEALPSSFTVTTKTPLGGSSAAVVIIDKFTKEIKAYKVYHKASWRDFIRDWSLSSNSDYTIRVKQIKRTIFTKFGNTETNLFFSLGSGGGYAEDYYRKGNSSIDSVNHAISKDKLSGFGIQQVIIE